jgi:hypothetical protein
VSDSGQRAHRVMSGMVSPSDPPRTGLGKGRGASGDNPPGRVNALTVDVVPEKAPAIPVAGFPSIGWRRRNPLGHFPK